MPRRLLVVNVLLAGVSLTAAAFIVWELVTPRPTLQARPRPVPAPGAAPALAPAAPRPPAAAYTVVATRNLFSPTRSEAPATGVAGGPALSAAKPNLYGVVLRDQSPIAYLEDPLTKRVAGYRVGDAIAGGTLQTIAADRVVIARPDGKVDVKLRDPSRPRPAAPPATPQPGTFAPGAPPQRAPAVGMPPGAATAAPPGFTPAFPAPYPGMLPGRQAVTPPQVQLQPGAPGTMVGPFLLPGQRPSPTLGRRLPAPPISGAPAPGAPQP